MKKLKFKREYYDLIKGLTDKQAGEFIKSVCAYVYEGKPFITKDEYLKGLFLYVKRELDVSEMNSINGKKGADVHAKKKRGFQTIELILGSVTVSADKGDKARNVNEQK